KSGHRFSEKITRKRTRDPEKWAPVFGMTAAETDDG
ncbi:MAG: hypothetical protein QOE78_4487, partial [Alphaproteobacteria bacterium]|nr:hypothetical protein [Alphaproteobacteria bacterium]